MQERPGLVFSFQGFSILRRSNLKNKSNKAQNSYSPGVTILRCFNKKSLA